MGVKLLCPKSLSEQDTELDLQPRAARRTTPPSPSAQHHLHLGALSTPQGPKSKARGERGPGEARGRETTSSVDPGHPELVLLRQTWDLLPSV